MRYCEPYVRIVSGGWRDVPSRRRWPGGAMPACRPRSVGGRGSAARSAVACHQDLMAIQTLSAGPRLEFTIL